MNSKGIGVVSVLSLAASALAVICFVTGRTTLSDFVAPHSSPASAASAPSPAPAPVSAGPSAVQTEQMLSQVAFFVHYNHLPGHGTDDYDADDTEQDRQTLIAQLEMYIAFASDKPQEKKRLTRAQVLRHLLGQMHPAAPPN